MMQRMPLMGCVILAAVLVAGSAFRSAHASEAKVTIDNFTFTPAEITVAVGTKLTWSNRDDIPHTVTDAANPRTFKSPALDTGDSFAYVFAATGTYHYFCSLHPHMQGTVIVR